MFDIIDMTILIDAELIIKSKGFNEPYYILYSTYALGVAFSACSLIKKKSKRIMDDKECRKK